MTTYRPRTIDTSHVQLPADLEELVERLTENYHDHWAQKRIGEGWRYGARRNDDAKEHPDLLPYDQLPESEKEYDRKTVIEVLKAIIALAYELDKGYPKSYGSRAVDQSYRAEVDRGGSNAPALQYHNDSTRKAAWKECKEALRQSPIWLTSGCNGRPFGPPLSPRVMRQYSLRNLRLRGHDGRNPRRSERRYSVRRFPELRSARDGACAIGV